MRTLRDLLAHLFQRANNWLSLIGIVITTVSVVFILILFVFDFLGLLHHSNAYAYLIAFFVLPLFFTVGLLLIPIGMLYRGLTLKKEKKSEEPEKQIKGPFPIIDLNDRRVRMTILILCMLTLVNILILSAVSYKAIEFTETPEFCGVVCHTVMKPEYTAYQGSPHSRVKCTTCHIGQGVSWFVASKLDGLRQVFSTLSKSYSKPIPTPIAHLRPARETCERCHWPGKYYGKRFVEINRYEEDEVNTKRTIKLVMHTGGVRYGKAKGIHWHINNPVWYVATDKRRQVIPWVQVEVKGKGKIEFISADSNLTKEQIRKMPKRRMDCIDCHNRATHVFLPPDRAMDKAMELGKISRNLPYIKKKGLLLLSATYASNKEAMKSIATLRNYYKKNYPKVAQKYAKTIESAIKTIQAIYARTHFPHMKVTWQTHPNNIGHRDFPGCFRCHEGRHTSSKGDVIRSNCDICHQIVQDFRTKDFVIRQKKHKIDCVQCHNILLAKGQNKPIDIRPPRNLCLSCHQKIKHPTHSKLSCYSCHKVHGKTLPKSSDCLACHANIKNKQNHKLHINYGLSCISCHKKDLRKITKETAQKVCSQCHTTKRPSMLLKAPL